MSRFFYIIFFLTVFMNHGYSQQPFQMFKESNDQKSYSTAIKLEKAGRLDEAEAIYLSLLNQNPRNGQVYHQLKSLYKKQNNFNKLEKTIADHITVVPRDMQSIVELGEIYFFQDSIEKAHDYWEEMLLKNSQSRPFYKGLIQIYIKYNMEEKLFETVKAGREIFNDPSFLAYDLGRYFSRKQNYGKSADEYITFAIHDPKQIQTASNRLLKMSDREESLTHIESKLNNRMSENEPVVRTLYSKILFKTGKYEEAYFQHHELGIASKEDFKRWETFADNLRKENQLTLALQSYGNMLSAVSILKESLTTSQYNTFAGKALYGLALTYEQQIIPTQAILYLAQYFPNNLFFENILISFPTNQNDETGDSNVLNETFALYDSILTTLPRSSFSSQAHFRIGEIKFRILHDFDGALESYFVSLQTVRRGEQYQKTISRIADVFMVKGNFEDALIFLKDQLRFIRSDEDEKICLMKQCQIHFLTGEVDSALKYLDNLIGFLDIGDDLINDVLEVKGFIDENYTRTTESGKTAFLTYLKGEQLLKQNKLSEAQFLFSSVRQSYSETPVYDEAIFREGEISVFLGDYENAVLTLTPLAQTPSGDRAAVMIGEIYEYHLNDKEEAIKWYLTVLDDYPGSLLTEPVRYKIRELAEKKEIN